jgi:hypothetical protein
MRSNSLKNKLTPRNENSFKKITPLNSMTKMLPLNSVNKILPLPSNSLSRIIPLH